MLYHVCVCPTNLSKYFGNTKNSNFFFCCRFFLILVILMFSKIFFGWSFVETFPFSAFDLKWLLQMIFCFSCNFCDVGLNWVFFQICKTCNNLEKVPSNVKRLFCFLHVGTNWFELLFGVVFKKFWKFWFFFWRHMEWLFWCSQFFRNSWNFVFGSIIFIWNLRF